MEQAFKTRQQELLGWVSGGFSIGDAWGIPRLQCAATNIYYLTINTIFIIIDGACMYPPTYDTMQRRQVLMPRNKHPEETIQKILDASLKLFLEKGYEQTTVLDIVANLGGLTRGAFYHHFKTKEDVLNALLEKHFAENPPFARVKNEEGLNGLEKITRAMNNMLTLERNVGITKTAQALLSLSNPRFLAWLLKSNKEVAPILESLIEEGMTDGSIPPGNAVLLTELFILLIHFWTFPAIFPSTKTVFVEKIKIIKQTLDNLGLPVFDEKFMGNHEILTELLDIPPDPEA